MIRVLVGDLLDSNAQTLVNTVNCVGIMGKGIALEFKKRFPEMYADYVRRCEAKEVRLGEPYLFRMLMSPWVLNFPTKGHWKSSSRLADIVAGLEYLQQHYREWGIESLAVPPLGCGHGQLEWRVVGPTLFRYLSRLDIPVDLYAPPGTPQVELSEDFLATSQPVREPLFTPMPSKIEPAWVALTEILARVAAQREIGPVNRTLLQCAAYFAEAAGIPVGLQYSLGKYGVYAMEFKSLLGKLTNNGLCTETQNGRAIVIQPGLTYTDATQTYQDDLARWELTIQRVTQLLLRLSSKTAEALATVHFVATSHVADAPVESIDEDVRDLVMREAHKREWAMSEIDIERMLRYLKEADWFSLAPN